MVTKAQKKKEISQLKPGTTGYELRSVSQYLDELDRAGVNLTSSRDWFREFDFLPRFPKSCNPLSFLSVMDQKRQGACAGFGTAQAGEGCFWQASGGAVQRFSGSAHYYLAQERDGFLGRDVGSMPGSHAWIVQNVGMFPKNACPPDPEDYSGRFEITDEMKEAAGAYKLKGVVHLESPKSLFDWLQQGQGYATLASTWPAHFDQGGSSPITSFHGPRRDDRHGGGHMYAIMGWYKHPQLGLCAVLVNSWNVYWGDEGAKLITLRALQEMFQHRFTVCIGMSDMDLQGREARTIDVESVIGKLF